jgi:ribosomal protein S18 acetylase RimI-like enzyme
VRRRGVKFYPTITKSLATHTYRKRFYFSELLSILSIMGELVIRKATVDDISSIVDVSVASTAKDETQGFAASGWITYSSSEELRKAWDEENRLKDGSEVIVAEKNRNIVGFIVFKMEYDYCYIDNIDITRDEQRKGIGRALVAHVENTARAKGYYSMKTDTTESAKGVPWKSYGFWIKIGYKDTGERLTTKWDFKTIPFVKNLK